MSGQLRKEDIIQQAEIQAALAAIAKSAEPVIEGFKKVAEYGKQISESVGGSDALKQLIELSKKATKNTQEFTAAEKERIKVQKQLETTIAKLNILRSEEGKKLVEEKVKLQEATRAARDMAREKLGLTQKTTGLRGAFDNFIKSIGVYAAAIFGLNRLLRFFTSDLLKLTEKLDSLDFSMKTVITSQTEFAQTQLFLSETAVNYGQDILTLTERYIKFRAATKQSNMSVSDTQKIFDSAAKAAAVLGLRTDEVNGVFLALEQMISKGKVTTEELRRQLGERLPGAFGIMADAMGVTIRELDRMLKAGEVLSSEALPKFADALEKAYGIEAVDKVDTLAAAQGRLKTSWVEFVDELEASDVYKNTLNNLATALQRLGMLINWDFNNFQKLSKEASYQGDVIRELAKKYDEFSIYKVNAELDDLNKVIEEQKSLIYEVTQSESEWQKTLDGVGISSKRAALLLKQYVDQRKQLLIEERKSKINPFDVEAFKKDLDKVKSDTESLVNVKNEELKKSIIESNKYLTDRVTTYKEVLELQEKEINFSRQRAKEIVDDYERLKTRRELTKEENDEYEQWSSRFIALTEAQIEVNNRLAESRGGKAEKDDSLKLMQERHKAELEETKKHQQELITQGKYSEDELQRVRYDNNKELLEQELNNIDKQLELVESGTVEHARLLTERKKLEADLAKDLTDFLIDEEKRRQREIERQAKAEKDERERLNREILADAEQRTHEEYLNLLDKTNQEIKASKGKADEIRRIDDQLTLDLIRNEMKQLDVALGSMDEETRAYEQAIERRKRLKEQEGEQINRIEGRTQEKTVELREATISKSGELLIEGFNLSGAIYDAQLASLEQYYQSEIAAAGDSVERRILAEKKYEREKAKLMRRQAIADKAQSALSIILNTAQAIMRAWADFPATAGILTAIISAIGATQLATVLAAPIPQFSKGTKDAPETFIAGEKGAEAIIKPSGDVVITPDEPTLFSDKSFIGSTILPHDQTRKMLANYAINQSYDMIDMSDTNRYLKNIADNTQRKKEVFIRNGKTVIRRGYVTSTIV